MDGNRWFFRTVRSERDDCRDVSGSTDRGETEKSSTGSQEKTGFHEIIWDDLFPKAFSIGITVEQFLHLTPIKLEKCFEGFKIAREREDSNMWLWFGTYGISAFSVAIDRCFNGKDSKMKYLEQPYLSNQIENDGEMSEEEIQRQREAFVMKMRTMKANYDISHQEKSGGN